MTLVISLFRPECLTESPLSFVCFPLYLPALLDLERAILCESRAQVGRDRSVCSPTTGTREPDPTRNISLNGLVPQMQ